MAHLPAPVARVRRAVRQFLTDRLDDEALAAGDLLLVACSGGADSVALASQVAFLAPRMNLRAGLITVDHGMQEGSARQAGAVVTLGRELGLAPVLTETPREYTPDPTAGPTPDPTLGPRPQDSLGAGPEGAARELRFAAFERALSAAGARAILLGHTMDDQAETVLLGLARGAGTRTVAGIPPMRGPYWRPILGVRREETLAACAELALPVWHDPSNAPDGPWRTAAGAVLPRAGLRHRVLPELARALGQDPVPALARTAELSRRDADYLEEVARGYHHLIWAPTRVGGFADAPAGAVLALAVDAVGALAAPVRWRVLREFLLRAGAAQGRVSLQHVRSVDALLTDWRGQQGVSVPGGLLIQRRCGRLYGVTRTSLERT